MAVVWADVVLCGGGPSYLRDFTGPSDSDRMGPAIASRHNAPSRGKNQRGLDRRRPTKGREKKRLDKNYVEQKDERSMYHRDWNPLGLPKNEWMALSSEERVAAYKKHFGQDKEEPKDHQTYVQYGPRGGRYTEETTRDGRRYRRYF